MNPLNRILALSATLFGLVACATAPAPAPLADTLSRDPQLSTFTRLVEQAGLQDELRAAGPLTVFVPSDDAFKALPAATLDKLSKDKDQLKAVLHLHMVASKLPASDVKNSSPKSLQGSTLALARAGDFVTVEDAVVQRADIGATNGVAHVIDRVLMPAKK
jgi:uncharacterized surface protein with fasciclin (FAS1) repeats